MRIIGLTGFARVGKDTVASYLEREHRFKVMAFADPLYEMLYPLVFGKSWDALFREGKTPRQVMSDHKDIEVFPGVTLRVALQTLGTEWGRGLYKNAWVYLMDKKLAVLRELETVDRVVIPDVRFPNEAECILGWSGEIWRVTRNIWVGEEWRVHESERHIVRHHRVIDNNRTVEDLYAAVEGAL